MFAQSRLRYLGHVLRMPEERAPKAALSEALKRVNSSVRGRPKLCWLATVRNDLAARNLDPNDWQSVTALAQDREAWRSEVVYGAPRNKTPDEDEGEYNEEEQIEVLEQANLKLERYLQKRTRSETVEMDFLEDIENRLEQHIRKTTRTK